MIEVTNTKSEAIRFCVIVDGQEVGRAFLYLIKNELNEKPYGLLEDLYVDEDFRGNGYGKKLITSILDKAKEVGCYKIIATSRYTRPKVHEMYQKFNFSDHGKEFRLDL